ncbi:MAG: hypothetical protein ABIW76_14455 [Fibrobacteria bacterium]
MNKDMNKVPEGRVLPEVFKGKKPLDVEQVVIGDDDTETMYKTLMKGGTYEVIPLSAFPEAPKPTKKEK